jgi:hypothetical protein
MSFCAALAAQRVLPAVVSLNSRTCARLVRQGYQFKKAPSGMNPKALQSLSTLAADQW